VRERKLNKPTFGDFLFRNYFFLKEGWYRFVGGQGKLLGKYIDWKGVGL
jgi:hypothetical protein